MEIFAGGLPVNEVEIKRLAPIAKPKFGPLS